MANETQETEAETVRAYTGALILAEATHDLRLIRTMLQQALTKN